jgi:hypothetical protein
VPAIPPTSGSRRLGPDVLRSHRRLHLTTGSVRCKETAGTRPRTNLKPKGCGKSVMPASLPGRRGYDQTAHGWDNRTILRHVVPHSPRGERVRHGVGKEPTVHTHSWGVQRSNKNDRKLVRSASVTGITAERARGGLAVDEPYIPFGESRHSAETLCCAMICLCLRGSENDSHKLD